MNKVVRISIEIYASENENPEDVADTVVETLQENGICTGLMTIEEN